MKRRDALLASRRDRKEVEVKEGKVKVLAKLVELRSRTKGKRLRLLQSHSSHWIPTTGPRTLSPTPLRGFNEDVIRRHKQ